MKKNLWLICILIFIAIQGCKKATEYKLSTDIKEYFTFKPGSYWIYRNDSTGDLDSTYVKDFSNFVHEEDKEIKWEVLVIDFESLFLKRLFVSVNSCKQINYTTLEIRDFSGIETDGGVIFYPDWPQDKLLNPECEPTLQYYYEIKSTDTINNQIYHDVLFTELKNIGVSQRDFFMRTSYSAYFGILKFYALNPQRHINSSFTLIRCKIIK